MERPDNLYVDERNVPYADDAGDILSNDDFDAIMRDIGVYPPLLTNEEVDDILEEYGWLPADAIPSRNQLTLDLDANGYPVMPRAQIRDWLAGHPGRVTVGNLILRGQLPEIKLDNLYAVLTNYLGDAIENDDASQATLLVQERGWGFGFVPGAHGEGPYPLDHGGENCVLRAVKKQWPALTKMCDWLNEKWPDGHATEDRLLEIIEGAGGREWKYNHTIGIEVFDAAGRLWKAYNTEKGDGVRREERRILKIKAGCHHAVLQRDADHEWDGQVENLPSSVFKESLREGRWGQIIHDGAYLHAGVLFRDEGWVQELLEKAGAGNANAKTYLTYDPKKEIERHPMVSSIDGLTAAVFAERAGVKPLPRDDPLAVYLAKCQIEHVHAEFLEVRKTDVEYDMNQCFASYRACWYTDYYRRYGLPHVPTIGGWLPEDVTAGEQASLLAQTGFAIVDQVRVEHWALEAFPYIVDNRPYPTVWLRFLQDKGLATFRLRHIMLGGKFFDTDLAGGDIARKVIGKWMTKHSQVRFFASSREEVERLCWSQAHEGHLVDVKEVEGGWSLQFEGAPPRVYPWLRAQALAYSHIALFAKLTKLAKAAVVSVNTDSITLRERDDEVFAGYDLMPFPGRWKVAADIRNGIPKMAKGPNGEKIPVDLRGRGYGTGRLEARRKLLEEEVIQPPGKQDETFARFLRGQPDDGVAPIYWETNWLLPPDTCEPKEKIREDFLQVPLVFILDGGGGHGKTTWASRTLEGLALHEKFVAHTSFQRETVHENRSAEKFGPEVSASTLHAWLYPKTEEMRDEAKFVSEAHVLFIDECSMLSQDLLDRVMQKPACLGGRVIFMAGDVAQLPDVQPREKVPRAFGPFKDVFGRPNHHEISFTKDHRSTDELTARLKASVRRLRIELGGDPARELAEIAEALASIGRPKRVGPLDKILHDELHGASAEDLVYRTRILCGRKIDTRPICNDMCCELAYGKRPTDDAVLPMRCAESINGGANAGEIRHLPWGVAKGLLERGAWDFGFASTTHSTQGKTIAKPIRMVFIADWTPPGLIYTALGRLQSIDQLSLLVPGRERIPQK